MNEYDRIKAAYDKACAELDAHPEWPRKFIMQRVPPGMAQIAAADKKRAEAELAMVKKRLRAHERTVTPQRKFKKRK